MQFSLVQVRSGVARQYQYQSNTTEALSRTPHQKQLCHTAPLSGPQHYSPALLQAPSYSRPMPNKAFAWWGLQGSTSDRVSEKP